MLLPVVKLFIWQEDFFLPAKISWAITPNCSLSLFWEQLLQAVELGVISPVECLPRELCVCRCCLCQTASGACSDCVDKVAQNPSFHTFSLSTFILSVYSFPHTSVAGTEENSSCATAAGGNWNALVGM